MNSLQSFSLIIGGIFLLPILVGLILYNLFRSAFDIAGGLLVGALTVVGPIWFAWMLVRLIYLKVLS